MKTHWLALWVLAALAACETLPQESGSSAESTAAPEASAPEMPGSSEVWRFTPDAQKLGFTLVSAPQSEVGGTAEMVFSVPADVELAYALRNKTKGVFLTSFLQVDRVPAGVKLMLFFPESGDYELTVLGTADSGKNFLQLAVKDFKARFVLSPAEKLQRALKSQDLNDLKDALTAGADPNAPVPGLPEDGRPVFVVLRWHDAFEKQIEALKMLKTHGADFRILTDAGDTVLAIFSTWVLCRRPLPGTPEARLRLLSTLLELGADPSQDSSYSYTYKLPSGDQRIQTTIPILLYMERMGYEHAAELASYVPLLVRYGARLRPRWPGGPNSPTALSNLFANYSRGTSPLIRAYLEAGADPIPDELLAMGNLVLSPAFDGGYELAELAIARSTHLNEPDRSGSTLQHTLARQAEGTPGARRKLFGLLAARGANLEVEDLYGRTPLLIAAARLNAAAVDDLLWLGVDPKRSNSRGETVLHHLPYDKTLQEIAPFVERFVSLGVNINARNRIGQTVLHLVANSGDDVELMKFLVAKGADPSIADIDGLTPMANAGPNGLEKLGAYHASLKIPDVRGGFPAGNTAPACRAVLDADLKALAALPLEQFQETTARTWDGVPATPLHLAAEGANLKVLQALIARKVDWNVGDRYGRTPLEVAVRAGRRETVEALLGAGADPNQRSFRGESAYAVAIAGGSPLLRSLLASGRKPEYITTVAAARAPVELVPELAPAAGWSSDDLETFAAFGRPDILQALGDSAVHYSMTTEDLLAEARAKADDIRRQEAGWRKPVEGRPVPEQRRHAKGSYLLTLEEWSPWLEVDPALVLKKYPVAVHVPKGYDGSRPYGLIVSMMNAKSSSQFPKPEYLTTLEKHRLLYVGFDPYCGVYEDGSVPDMHTDHELLVLAAAYHMLGAYNVDRARVYLAGFSWGGKLTGEIAPRHPGLFTGGIAVGGCFTTQGRSLGVNLTAWKRLAMVLASSDWDYNRDMTYGGYTAFRAMGYPCHYLQEPRRKHAQISGEFFEKAVALLDAAAAATR